jgi:V8-like Glu-specific endopeptidase
MKVRTVIGIAVAMLGIGAYAMLNESKVIYGDDDRIDPYETTNGILLGNAKSTAAMIDSSIISIAGNLGTIRANSLQTSMGACANERFASQPVAANCSGFLVKNDMLVTAGHCITGASACAKYSWVFDFAYTSKGSNPTVVNTNSIYKCKRVVSRSQDNTTMNDYALIQLDRPVTDRMPLKYRKEGKIGLGTPVYVIGYPSGMPVKIAGGAKVTVLENTYFSSNLDTYGGNSGSSVFNGITGEIEGILVRGATDYLWDSNRNCRYSNVLSNDTVNAEEITYITNISELKSKMIR